MTLAPVQLVGVGLPLFGQNPYVSKGRRSLHNEMYLSTDGKSYAQDYHDHFSSI